ncbi:MAG: EAL domain-containing protein [Pseudomonadota bacterium]
MSIRFVKIGCWHRLVSMLFGSYLILTVSSPLTAAPLEVPSAKPHVLVLDHVGLGRTGHDLYINSFTSTLIAGGMSSEDIFVEYLDLGRNPGKQYRLLQQQLLTQKYSKRSIDLVFVLQPPTLDFLLQDAADLFHGAPVLVVLAPLPDDALSSGRRFVLQSQKQDFFATVKYATQLFPETKAVLVLAGNGGPAETARVQAIKTELARWKDTLSITYTDHMTYAEMERTVVTLPPDTIVLSASPLQDVSGRSIPPAEFGARIAKISKAPMFVAYDSLIGVGAVGGSVFSIKQAGVRIGTEALDILNGKLVLKDQVTIIDTIPIAMFDWLQLIRWGADLDQLPADAVIINRPKSLWEHNRAAVMLAIAAFITLFSLIALLLLQIRRKYRTEEALLASEERFRTLVEHAPEAILVYDADQQRFVNTNLNAEKLFGCSREALLNSQPGQFYSLNQLDGKAVDDTAPQNNTAALAGVQVVTERMIRTADGQNLTCEVRLVKLPSIGKNLLRASFVDITQRKLAEAKIEQLAFYDPLTGQPNRRLLLNRLQQAVSASARSQRHGALLFLDIDHFKMLNDTLGHDKGDLLLKEVARRLDSCLRMVDTAARLGGDEFVVMLEDLGEEPLDAAIQAESVGEDILAALCRPYDLGGREYRSSASIGIALFGRYDDNMDELLKRADLAMYQAKAAGRNNLRFFDPEIQAAATARSEMEADLREAVRLGEFIVHFQPQVDHEGFIAGAEALIRWQHPTQGLISPAQFVPLAEETGLILPIGSWVLETACEQLVVWANQPNAAHLILAVNVSVRQFLQEDFVEEVLSVIRRTGADPTRLKLELTESLLVDDVDHTISKMCELKARGVSFALDDFGTGYSSLAYLKRLPLEQLKIDQSFVRDLLTDPNDVSIARTIVALANSLGLSVIAEGVETAGQRDILAFHGCHSYQGFLFSHPLPLLEFNEFLDSHVIPLSQ